MGLVTTSILVWFLALASTPAAARVDPASLVSVPSPFSAGCGGAAQPGTLYRNAEVEPYIASNPTKRRNLIAVWQQDRWSSGGADGLLTAYSNDGGETWKHPAAPPFARCQGGTADNGGDYERVTDPWVSFGPTGIAYQIALAGNDLFLGRHAVLLSRSHDGGRTWGKVKTLIVDDGPLLANDKETVTADPIDPDYVYATWWRNDLRNGRSAGPTMFTRSSDRGVSWEPAREIFDSGSGPLNQTIGNQIVVKPNGNLVNGFMWITTDPFDFQVVTIRSKDKGRTWGRETTIAHLASFPAVTDPRDGAAVRTGDVASIDIAADPRRGKHRMYAVWQDTVFTGQSQIALSRSRDGGRTWSVPVRVSENPDTQAFTPALEVNPSGEVAIGYYDFTYDTAASPGLETDYWVARSTDGGRSFAPRERVTPHSFDMRTAPNANGFFVGDYEGLAVAGNRFELLFAQTTGDADNPTDLFATTVEGPVAGGRLHPPRAPAQPLRPARPEASPPALPPRSRP